MKTEGPGCRDLLVVQKISVSKVAACTYRYTVMLWSYQIPI